MTEARAGPPARGRRRGRACGTSSAPTGCCSMPRSCPGRPRPAPDRAAVRAGRRFGARRPRGRRTRRRERPHARRAESRRCATGWPRRADEARRYAKAWAPLCLAGGRRSTISRSRPSTCWPARARVHFDQDHLWHMAIAARLADGRRAARGADGRCSAWRWRRRGASAEAIALVGGAHRRRRRGHGGQAPALRRPRREGPGPAGAQGARAAITCASSTDPNTTCPRTWTRLRERGLGGKRALALREFALGHEALTRFVAGAAAAPGARVRLRRPGAGERADRPEALEHRDSRHSRATAGRLGN